MVGRLGVGIFLVEEALVLGAGTGLLDEAGRHDAGIVAALEVVGLASRFGVAVVVFLFSQVRGKIVNMKGELICST